MVRYYQSKMFSLIRNLSTPKNSLFLNMNRQINNRINIFHLSKFFYGKKKKPSLKIDQENWQRMNQDRQKKKYGYLQIGMYGLVFALCFAAIPLYRVFCQRVGLIGNYDKKQYTFNAQQIKNTRKYRVKFEGQPQPGIDWQFQSVQKQVTVGVGQTAIVFYRLYNKEDKPIVGFSTYNISPQEANLYFSKIQCFCFNQQMVNPKEQLLLPLFFYLQPQLADDPDVGRIRDITINYQFLKSSKQDLAKFAEEQLRRIQENKRKLNQIRAKKQNVSLEEYESKIENEADQMMMKNMRQMVQQQKKRQQAEQQQGNISDKATQNIVEEQGAQSKSSPKVMQFSQQLKSVRSQSVQ